MTRLNLLQSLRGSLPFLSRRQGALPRAQMLALKPVRSRGVAWEMDPEADTPTARLSVPRRDDRLGQILARLFRVPATRTVELDEINTQLWVRCDGQHSVDQLIRYACDTYKMNRRQGEVGVITAMRMLTQRGLIGLASAKPAAPTTPNAPGPSASTGGKGTHGYHQRQRPAAGKRRRRH
jgi:hypothetical protein